MSAILTLVAMLAAAPDPAATAPTRPPLERIGRPMNKGARLPFSDAVRVGDILFLSGQIGLRPDGTLPADFAGQARQTMDNIGGVLATAKLGWGDVAKCTVMIDDMANWPAFNAIYVGYFPDGEYPARSAFGADGLALGALVAVECIVRAPSL